MIRWAGFLVKSRAMSLDALALPHYAGDLSQPGLPEPGHQTYSPVTGIQGLGEVTKYERTLLSVQVS